MRALLLAGGLALGATHGTAQDATQGQELYMSRCGGCHGANGMGDGPMAPLITVVVADLTQLALRNGGLFPRAEVVRTIDGRTEILAHGGPMPVFGPVLGGGSAVIDGPDGSVIETKGDVLAIALYLESIQAE